MIRRGLAQWPCARKVTSATPPKISSCVSKLNGEIVVMDAAYQSAGSRARKAFPQIAALVIVFHMARFRACSLLPELTTETNSRTTGYGLSGTPRVILDAGPPGLLGPEWERLSHVYFWQMVAAPPRAPNQSGILGRSFRYLKIAARAIMTDQNMIQGQDVLPLASIARRHAPHSVTGIPPSLAMTGRADLLAGAASAISDHDPPLAILRPRKNGMPNILNARNAAILDSARQALRTCMR